tara:strand:- start:83 stop:814 length:732 start_codon:yes stop_codon:yes gene_type:complete
MGDEEDESKLSAAAEDGIVVPYISHTETINLNGENKKVEFKTSKSVKSVDARKFVTYKTEIFLDGKSDDERNEEYGSFEVDGEGFDTGKPVTMTIRIIDYLKDNGYSRILVRETCNLIEYDYSKIRIDQMFLIDVDASDGFWEHIGMEMNRHFYTNSRRDLEARGYEKHITFPKLCKWAFFEKEGGGIKKEKTKKLKTRRKIKTRRKLKKRKYTKKKIKKRKRRKRKKAKNKKKKNRTRKNIF